MFKGYIKIVQRDISAIARACRSNALGRLDIGTLGHTAFYYKMAKMLNVSVAISAALRLIDGGLSRIISNGVHKRIPANWLENTRRSVIKCMLIGHSRRLSSNRGAQRHSGGARYDEDTLYAD